MLRPGCVVFVVVCGCVARFGAIVVAAGTAHRFAAAARAGCGWPAGSVQAEGGWPLSSGKAGARVMYTVLPRRVIDIRRYGYENSRRNRG